MAKKIYKGEVGIIDTTYIYDYEDYVDHCDINNREPKEEGSADYWQFVYDRRSDDYADELANLGYMAQMNEPCVITGRLGLWHGRPQIEPVRMPDVVSAIRKCNGTCDDVKVKWKDGVIEVRAMHHDGTNCFEIHRLSKQGVNASQNWCDGIGYGVEIKDYMVGKYYHPYM